MLLVYIAIETIRNYRRLSNVIRIDSIYVFILYILIDYEQVHKYNLV